MSIKAMKEALEVLDDGNEFKTNSILRHAIEDAEKAEPVAWRYDQATYGVNDLRGRQWMFNIFSQTAPYMNDSVRNVTPLYAHPPARKPLSEGDE